MKFQSILTYLPNADGSDEVMECSIRLARETGAPLALAEVLKPLPGYLKHPTYGYPALSDTLEREAMERMQATAGALHKSGLNVSTVVLTGKAHEELVREALRSGHDLLIAPRSPAGSLTRSSSTAVRLCRLCPATVLAVQAEHTRPFRRILATVDPLSHDAAGRELNEQVMEAALEMARLERGKVSVLFVWGEDLPPSSLESHGDQLRHLAESALQDFLQPYAHEIAPTDALLEFGQPSETICRVAVEQEFDLVVLGTIARRGLQALWIGNTAEETLANLDLPVLAVKPPGFVSPIDGNS